MAVASLLSVTAAQAEICDAATIKAHPKWARPGGFCEIASSTGGGFFSQGGGSVGGGGSSSGFIRTDVAHYTYPGGSVATITTSYYTDKVVQNVNNPTSGFDHTNVFPRH